MFLSERKSMAFVKVAIVEEVAPGTAKQVSVNGRVSEGIRLNSAVSGG